MSLIEKIDAEIKEALIGRQYGLNTAEYRVGIARGLEIAKEFILSEQKEPCEWVQTDEDTNLWQCSKCDALWFSESGSPKDNDMYYCPVCGRPLNQPYIE